MKVLAVASRYVGNKELYGNKFIDDPKIIGDLGELIKKAGQNDGEAWCAYFAEAMFAEAYPEKVLWLRKYFSASAVKTHEAFVKAGIQSHMIPKAGDLMIMQRYEKGLKSWQGHAGIVEKVNADGSWISIEGNTNNGGSREGDGVYRKHRKNQRTENGLNLLGFLTLI